MVDRIESAQAGVQALGAAIGIARAAPGITQPESAQSKRQTAGPVDHWAQLPSANHFIDDPRSISSELLVAAKGQFVQAVDNHLLFADVVVTALSCPAIPGDEAVAEVDPALPGIVAGQRKAVGHLLRHRDLQSIEMAVLIVAVVADAVGPAALPAVMPCVGSSGTAYAGSWQAGKEAAVIPEQVVGVGRASIRRNADDAVEARRHHSSRRVVTPREPLGS